MKITITTKTMKFPGHIKKTFSKRAETGEK